MKRPPREVDYQQPTGIIGQDAESPCPPTIPMNISERKQSWWDRSMSGGPSPCNTPAGAVERQIKGVNPAADQRVKKAPVVLKRLKVSREVNTQLLLHYLRAQRGARPVRRTRLPIRT